MAASNRSKFLWLLHQYVISHVTFRTLPFSCNVFTCFFIFLKINSNFIPTELPLVGLANEKPVFSARYDLNLYIKHRLISVPEVLNCVILTQAFAVLLLKSSFFRSVTLCRLGNCSWHFEGSCFLYLQAQWVLKESWSLFAV